MRLLVPFLLVTVALAGCADGTPSDVPLDSDGDGAPDQVEIEPATGLRVVVGVLDTAINPYHEHFQRPGGIPDALLATFVDAATGQTPERVRLASQGTYEERREADEAFWSGVEPGRMYHFEDTSIVAVSHGGNIIDGGSHGTATSGAVLDGNPNATILFSQGFGGASEAWTAQQPWVDFMSESYGPPGSPPLWLVQGSSTADANRQKWQGGGIPVGASDNTPALAPIDSTAGPPWVVGVAGDHPESEAQCREHVSGTFPDVTADFTQYLPLDRSIDGYGDTSGTSFATPMTAGVLSAILWQVRLAWSHAGGITEVMDDTARSHTVMAWDRAADGASPVFLDNVGLREALNRTAYYFPVAAGVGCGTGGAPVNPAAPWLQQGWGHVGPEIVDDAVACILATQGFADRSPCPQRPEAAVAFMTVLHEERKASWGLT